ncbi:MAG: 2-phosphosulfolactate phosphatase [Mariniblastus sp.]|nr:2-phosphosulfolactate phosphatase [Mariniblastus sp.]
MPRLQVGLLPSLIEPESLQDRVVVVVDVIRATTTICMALTHGARAIVPAHSIPVAHQYREQWGPDTLLCGERRGFIIDGFDHGSSPPEYTEEAVRDRTLVLCTTNGTVAMDRCRQARRVLVGSFVNLSAVANELREAEDVTVVCAGTNGLISSEDVLFAGALLDRIGRPDDSLDDSARLAVDHWRQAANQMELSSKSLFDFLAESNGGRNLLTHHFDHFVEDVRFCSQIDLIDQVPELNLAEWKIQFLASPSE